MKIFNIKQASLFLAKGATAINCGLGNKNKTYIEFKEDEIFKKLIKKWMAKEF